MSQKDKIYQPNFYFAYFLCGLLKRFSLFDHQEKELPRILLLFNSETKMGGHLAGPTLYIFIGLIHIHSSTSQMVPPMNGPSMQPTQPFHNFWPDRRGPARPMPSSPTTCRDSPCQNSGTCINTNNVTHPFECKCRPLYLGRLCEIVVKSPKKLKLVDKGAYYMRVSWEPPDVNKEIFGYVVQHHEFGTDNVTRSDLIHPSTLQYTIEDLQEDTQYTVCINIVFDEVTFHHAVLREQCLEEKTEPIMISLTSITPIAIICAAVFTLFILIFVVILCLSKRKGQKNEKQNSGTFTSMSWRRGHTVNSYQDQSYLTNKELNDSVQFTDEMFHHSAYTQNQTNNASRDSRCEDEVFYKPQPKEIYMNQHNFTRSCSVSVAPSSSSPIDHRYGRSHSTSLATFQSKHKRTSSVPHASYRELPPSISNHMMRSPTARDKDATNEFDIGSYFLPRS